MNDDETVWAFDLGKGSIGEAVRQGTRFLHTASLLIPADFAGTRSAATRRRMWRTRTAHRERERWLQQIWAAAGLPLLYGRNRDGRTGEWKAGEKADRRLEQEFAEPGDDTCYTSCLLRIKLLRGEKLEEWQIFKALHSAIQRRGYERIPWAEKEARRAGKTPEDLEKEEQKKDPDYVAALNRWREFKTQVPPPIPFSLLLRCLENGAMESCATGKARVAHHAPGRKHAQRPLRQSGRPGRGHGTCQQRGEVPASSGHHFRQNCRRRLGTDRC